MTKSACPSDASLLRFVDDDMSREETERVRDHTAGCQHCSEQERTLRQLQADVRAPWPEELDVAAHVRDVMTAVDAVDSQPSQPRRAVLGPRAFTLTAIAASALLAIYLGLRSPGQFQARGGGESTIARDVGIQLYEKNASLRPLPPGATIRADAAFTAGFRNLNAKPVSLLLFALDARNTVHWISPSYSDAQTDPVATQLATTTDERLLPLTVVFDDLAPGALRVISVISPTPTHVSDIETLAANSFNPRDITRRLPQAEVREAVLQVVEGSVTP